MPSKINPTEFEDGQPVSKSALRETLATIKREVEQRGYATIHVNTPDPAAVIQAVDDEHLIPKIIGPLTLPNGLQLRVGGLQGTAGERNSEQAISLPNPIVIGRPSDSLDPQPDRVSHYGHMRDLSLEVGDPTQPVVTNNEAHWQIIDNVAIQGTTDPGVPKIRFNATLYNRVTNSHIAGDGDGIYAREIDYPITYYGWNASWLDRSIFFQNGVAAWLHGVFSLRDCAIENSGSIAPKVILGDGSGYAAAKAVLDHLYFETKTDGNEPSIYPCIEIRENYGAVITNCVFNHNNENHADSANAVTINMTEQQTHCTIRYNSFALGATNDDATAINARAHNHSYHEYIGNHWSTNNNYKIKHNGDDMKTKGAQNAALYNQRVYIRDRHHGEVRQCMPQRDIWLLYSGDAGASIRAEGGRNHVIRDVPTGDITVVDRDEWIGARLTIQFATDGITLKEGNDFFRLAAGEDTAIPSGTVLEFVIDNWGNVREVGAATLALKLAAATTP